MGVGPSRGSESVIWSRKACTARVTLLRAATIAGVSAGWAGSVNATRSARIDALDESADPTSDAERNPAEPSSTAAWASVSARAAERWRAASPTLSVMKAASARAATVRRTEGNDDGGRAIRGKEQTYRRRIVGKKRG